MKKLNLLFSSEQRVEFYLRMLKEHTPPKTKEDERIIRIYQRLLQEDVLYTREFYIY